jgi:hypothetical protein
MSGSHFFRDDENGEKDNHGVVCVRDSFVASQRLRPHEERAHWASDLSGFLRMQKRLQI